jgi:hypothetical protein
MENVYNTAGKDEQVEEVVEKAEIIGSGLTKM